MNNEIKHCNNQLKSGLLNINIEFQVSSLFFFATIKKLQVKIK